MNQYQKNNKPMNVNVVNELLSKSMLAVDVETDEPVNVTAMQDPDGKYVLRLVDAAPYLAQITGYNSVNHSAARVTSSSTTILAENALRKYALITNLSETDPIFLSFDGPAVAETGIVVFPQSSYEMSCLKGNLFKGAITAIKGGEGEATLLLTEGVDA